MAKDPAFLFYPNDYLGGTMGMTFEEKGAYMELLMLQFNRGHMTKHMMGQTVGQLLDKVLDKFKIDEDGLYYNERLEQEKEKRNAFVASRLNNKEGKNQYSKKRGHMASHMENENRNENIIEERKERGVGKGKQKIDEKEPIPPNVLEAAEMNQWTLHQNRHTEFIKSQWGVFLKERNNDPPVKRMMYIRQPSELYQYFLNWIRNKKPTNGTHKQNASKPVPQPVSSGGFGQL
jgi:uncharacterized protein YdaU (DUF1376 family)